MPEIQFTETQHQIIQSPHPKIVVEAQPGSGKTRVLVERLRLALKFFPPQAVVAITFTEKSAKEILHRLFQGISLPLDGIWVSTIHGFCYRILRANTWAANLGFQFQIMSGEQAIYLKQKAFEQVFSEKIKSKDVTFHQILQDYGLGRLREIVGYLFENFAKGQLYPPEGHRGGRAGMVRRDENPVRMLAFELDSKQGASEALLEREFPAGEFDAVLKEDTVVLLRNLFQQIQTTYQTLKTQKNLVDYDDLLFKTAELLENFEDIRQYYQTKFKLILVDEFQDTDPIQAKIIRLLTTSYRGRPVPRLMIVGDPKQSIYRFRGADLEQFSAFKKDVLQASGFCFQMQENFRSHDKLIAFTNILFDQIMDDYTSSRAVRAYTHAVPSITYGVPKEKWDSLEGRTREARWLATKIKTEDLSHQTIVILFRAMTYADLYEKELSIQKIPFIRQGATKLFQNTHVRALLSLLKWTLTKDQFSFLHVLKASWGKEFVKILKTLRENLKHISLEAWFRIALSHDDLEPFFEMVRRFETENPKSSPEDFLEYTRWLEMASVTSPDEEDVKITSGKVQLMTIHQAKGLEFDTVYLPDLSYTPKADMPPLLIDKKLGVGVKIFKNMKHISENETYPEIVEKEKEAQIHESKRLFYVAITRAKERLVLSHGVQKPRSKSLAAMLIDHTDKLSHLMQKETYE